MNHVSRSARRLFLRQIPSIAVIPFLPAALGTVGCEGTSVEEVEDIIMGVLKVIAEVFKIYNSVSGSQEVEYTGQAGQGVEMAVELHEGSSDSSNTKLVDGVQGIYDLVPGQQALMFDGLKAKAEGAHFVMAFLPGAERRSADFLVQK